jgi:hypothetical protein
MILNEFSPNVFYPRDDQQMKLVEDIRNLRATFGLPHRYRVLRSLAKTRKHTRTVYPPGWNSDWKLV